MISETGNKEITSAEQTFDLHSVFNEDVPIISTDRLVFSLFVDITGGGTSTVRLYMEGVTDSHFTFRTPSSVLQEIFIRRDGTNPLTGNWNVGGFNITNIDDADVTTLLVHEPPVDCPISGGLQTFMTSTNMTTSVCIAEKNNLSNVRTNNTLGNVSIIQYNASCAGFRFNNSLDAGGLFSCMP